MGRVERDGSKQNNKGSEGEEHVTDEYEGGEGKESLVRRGMIVSKITRGKEVEEHILDGYEGGEGKER